MNFHKLLLLWVRSLYPFLDPICSSQQASAFLSPLENQTSDVFIKIIAAEGNVPLQILQTFSCMEIDRAYKEIYAPWPQGINVCGPNQWFKTQDSATALTSKYAIRFLTKPYEELGFGRSAAGAYRSRTPVVAENNLTKFDAKEDAPSHKPKYQKRNCATSNWIFSPNAKK
jgi:hypothetical protein